MIIRLGTKLQIFTYDYCSALADFAVPHTYSMHLRVVAQFYLKVQPATSVTNIPTDYTFEITTSFAFVPASTIVKVTFPGQYMTAPTSLNCTNVQSRLS